MSSLPVRVPGMRIRRDFVADDGGLDEAIISSDTTLSVQGSKSVKQTEKKNKFRNFGVSPTAQPLFTKFKSSNEENYNGAEESTLQRISALIEYTTLLTENQLILTSGVLRLRCQSDVVDILSIKSIDRIDQGEFNSG